jgi:hypothetical protein
MLVIVSIVAQRLAIVGVANAIPNLIKEEIMKFLIVVECTMRDEIELEHKPTGAELLKMMDDVNKQFEEKGLKVRVEQIRATHIIEPVEEEDHD